MLAAGAVLARSAVRDRVPEPAAGRRSWRRRDAPRGAATAGTPATLGAGLLSGTAGVLVGVGGPLVTTPVLVAGGVALAPAVGAGLANNAVVAGIRTVGLLPQVVLHPGVLAVVTGCQLAGVVAGVRWRRLVPATAMAVVVAAVAVLTGAAFLVAALT